MQKWEYKIEYRSREVYGDWSQDMEVIANKLGNEGWELISVAPRSGKVWRSETSSNISGFSSEEIWVFKRPIS